MKIDRSGLANSTNTWLDSSEESDARPRSTKFLQTLYVVTNCSEVEGEPCSSPCSILALVTVSEGLPDVDAQHAQEAWARQAEVLQRNVA